MPSRRTADKLILTKSKRDRRKLLAVLSVSERLLIAHELKNLCYKLWGSAPVKAQQTARALNEIAALDGREEISALAFWASGIAELTRGRLDKAIANLDRSASFFRKLKKDHEAASAQVAKIIALALLGDYNEAIKTGKTVLRVFEKHGDELAAGKVEKNLGNIIARQSGIPRAEKYYVSAMRRFRNVNDVSELTMCETNLADNFADLNDFVLAEKYYALALGHARDAKLHFVEAEIVASMGNLAMLRGRYGDALRYLELSRRQFEGLRITHRSVVANLEIAEIYQTVNLVDEAFAIYSSIAPKFRRLKLQGEEAKARANFGRAALSLKDFGRAKRELSKAAVLYEREKNIGGLTDVMLAGANLEMAIGKLPKALEKAKEAGRLIGKTTNIRQKLAAKWLRGEILKKLGRTRDSRRVLDETFADAISQEQNNLAQICLNSLGELALGSNETERAEDYFLRSVAMIETLRAPLGAEEFRMAFLADKLAPYENLAKMYLDSGCLERAFDCTEKARARTLAENLTARDGQPKAKKDAKLTARLETLREELNWFYSRITRASAPEAVSFQNEARKREKEISAVMRQLESTGTLSPVQKTKRGAAIAADSSGLRNRLGDRKALVEYFLRDGVLGAFVVTKDSIQAATGFANQTEVLALLEGLQFQFGALRYGVDSLSGFMVALKNRADFYLSELYKKLIAPVEHLVGDRDLVVVPVGATHYVPFHALRRDDEYLIETREVVYAPSAAVWQNLNERTEKTGDKALLIGFADDKIPLVDNEIASLRSIFPEAESFTGDNATFSNYQQRAPDFDILHLACHGQFRPENPLFSSLHLADGFVTVRDICAQRLSARLVTLSACETGLNRIYAGDEILGLARGFLAAGAESLVLSLWTVNDESTTKLMTRFYKEIKRGKSVAAALRAAQIGFIKRGQHPYFWSPFVTIGK